MNRYEVLVKVEQEYIVEVDEYTAEKAKEHVNAMDLDEIEQVGVLDYVDFRPVGVEEIGYDEDE